MQTILVLVAAGALLTVAFSQQADDFCGGHQVGCSLVTGFVGTALVILGGYFFLFVWTLRKALGHYVELASRRPERLFTAPPRLRAEPAARTSLTNAVARESVFSRRGAPVLVVGEGGSGKTTFLVEMTRHLARSGTVPVPVALRGVVPPLNFRALAEAEFVRHIDPVVRSREDAQRIWQRLSAEGAIVVLADGLDEIAPSAPSHERDQVIRSALVAASNDRLSTVVTSRPEALPPGAPVSLFEIGDLEPDKALGYLRRTTHLRNPADQQRLGEMVAAGRLTRTPFYLALVGSLLRAGKQLPPTHGLTTNAFLVALVDGWVDLVQDDRFLAEVEMDMSRRREIVAGLESIAYAMAAEAMLESRASRLPALLDGPSRPANGETVNLGAVTEGAARLELIRAYSTGEDASIRFNHSISQAYFASRFLRGHPEAVEHAIQHARSREMHDALVMLCARSGDLQLAETVCSGLLKRAEFLGDDRALAHVISAAEIAADVGLAAFPRIAAEIHQLAWGRASPRGKVAAIRRLEDKSDPWCYEWLHAATRDGNYRVRWSAARAIVAGGQAAYAALATRFAETLDYAESHAIERWEPDAKAHDIAVLGWLVPALRCSTTGPARDDLEVLVRRFVDLVQRRVPYGHEASIAQGFKLGALANPAGADLDVVADLINHCRFWYSRIVLIQALCITALSRGEQRKAGLRRVIARERRTAEHPLVREAASLAARALETEDWRPYVWEDESSVLGTSGSMLADETTVLLADVVLLLNVTEQGGREASESRKERTFSRTDLPYCLSASRDREEQLLLDGCDQRCEFQLCPYPSAAELSLARGEFSRAFCQHQIDRLARHGRLRSVRRRHRAGWWSQTGRAAMTRFWEELERRVV